MKVMRHWLGEVLGSERKAGKKKEKEKRGEKDVNSVSLIMGKNVSKPYLPNNIQILNTKTRR